MGVGYVQVALHHARTAFVDSEPDTVAGIDVLEL